MDDINNLLVQVALIEGRSTERYLRMRQARYIAIITILGLSSHLGIATAQQLPEDQAAGSFDVEQELSLFEEVESNTIRENLSARPSREARATTAEPEFTLIGTTRIGDNQSAMIQHRSGETLVVNIDASGNSAIANYTDYSIVHVSGGKISIRYPSNTPCIEFEDRGVRCNGAANIAELSLTNSAPIASRVPVESTDEQPANPFEALRNAQNGSGQDGDEAGARFTPRRINPEDVPEGMRVIATPFGDRLVEQ